MTEIIKSMLLILIVLNPFLLIIYLIDIVKKQTERQFSFAIIRAGIISCSVFIIFAILGNYIFQNILQANFYSFQIFGGIIFLLIAIKFVFNGNAAINGLRGDSKHVTGAIAMPIMIGPGTISASIMIGEKLNHKFAILSIFLAVLFSVVIMILLKYLHDYVKIKRAYLIDRYVETAGRITALVIGTIAIEMIMRGLKIWIAQI
ncbi:MAG: MarC family protein [Candidatus Marinimicrobia bacterium]|jgi:multiple antibiotic resistance protein|nr:MarC family protein [Candidatus Neomarinimicrobiota bacterium]